MPVDTDLDRFRLQLGDTASPPLFDDDQAAYFIAASSSIDGAVAMAVRSLVLRYAQMYDVTVDGQSFSRSQVATMLEKHGATLTAAGRSTVGSAFVTRVDAYSDDVSAQDTRGASDALDGYDLDPDHDIPA